MGRITVAPARERGLKCKPPPSLHLMRGRSRKGAWIEIAEVLCGSIAPAGRSRKGAWIEISPEARVDDVLDVAPARERGVKCFHLFD